MPKDWHDWRVDADAEERFVLLDPSIACLRSQISMSQYEDSYDMYHFKMHDNDNKIIAMRRY